MLRMGVIGVGRWGRNHVRVLAELSREFSELALTAVCDIDMSRAVEVAKVYGIPYAFSDVGEFLKYVDATVIATSIESLSEVALKTIAMGKHALIEKPVATSSRAVAMLDRLVEEKGVVVGVGYIMRFNPVVEFIKGHLTRFNPVFMLFRRFSRRPSHIKKTHIVLDLAVHDIDLCLYLTNVNHWRLEAAKILHTDIDDSVIAILRAGDVYCSIHVDGVSVHKVREIDILGTNAFVRGNTDEGNIMVQWSNGKSDAVKIHGDEPLKKELRSFIDSVKRGRPEGLASLRDAINVLRIVEEIMSHTQPHHP